MKRISIGLILGLGLAAVLAVGDRPSARAANPAANFHGGGANQTLFNVVTTLNPTTNRVLFQSTFTPFTAPPRVTQQIGNPVNILATSADRYFSGTGITCTRSGTHATGWRGPFLLASSGNNSISCTLLNFNPASSGWSGGWVAHVCVGREFEGTSNRQRIGIVDFCTTTPN